MSHSIDAFDIAALTALCARWPADPVPPCAVGDPLMERIRQVLCNLQRQPSSTQCADIIPLLRQVLLRAAGSENERPWMRVPLTSGWPTPSSWEDEQFDVLDDEFSLRIRPRWPRLLFLPNQPDLYDDAFVELRSRPDTRVRGDVLLRSALSLPTYTGEGQREAMRALLHLPPGHSLIANLPTGSGKSILAQLPPLIEPEGLLTLAIVPTVALAIDQASRMRALLKRRYPHKELPPLAFHGGLTSDERRAVFCAIDQGAQPILFTSPEYAVGSLREALERAAFQRRLSRLIIDEAHLVIGWGNGFRPAFQLLPALVGMLRGQASSNPLRVVLASATLAGSTIRDLQRLFGPPERTHVVSAVHLRPEIRYAFLRCGEIERASLVLQAVRFAPRPFILYVTRPVEADIWLDKLREAGLNRVDKFTGETSATERTRLLEEWRANQLDGMVATSAFGLGVDKGDVRAIIHATLPDSLDRYYQEVGRAGRDGHAGAALLLYTEADCDQARSLAFPTMIGDDNGHERWITLIDHAERHATEPGVCWVDLSRLPAHLAMRSDANQNWNVRLLTLMARARLVELVDLASRGINDAETPQSFSNATHAAIRILDDGHRNVGVFGSAMGQARKEVFGAAERGFLAMKGVATGDIEVSHGLRDMYSVTEGTLVPVSVCCGGCPVHWANRGEHVSYRPPMIQRLPRFAPRSLRALNRLALPMAASHLLVIDIPSDHMYAVTCATVVKQLAQTVECHTIAIERSFAQLHLTTIEQALPSNPCPDVFIDTVDADKPEQWRAGVDEVRIVIWGNEHLAAIPESLWLSEASLEVLVIPTDLPHPHHSLRRLVDTTPHVHATDLLNMITS